MFRQSFKLIMVGVVLFAASFMPMQQSQAASSGKSVTNFTSSYQKKHIRKAKKRRKIYRRARGYHGAKRYHGAKKSIIAAVRRHARAAGVPVRVALSVVRQESNFRPHARGRAGEIGLMQLKCSTARGEGYRGSCRGLYGVSTNLRYGMRYLRKALRRGGVGYYNAGLGAKRLPARARRYARQVHSRI